MVMAANGINKFLKLNTQGKNLNKNELQEAKQWKERYEATGK